MRIITLLMLPFLFLVISTNTGQAAPAEVFKECFALSEDWNERSACVNKWQADKTQKDLEELRVFLDENPRYRYPGQSLNKCFGKKRKVVISEVEYKKNGSIIIRYPEYFLPCYD